MQDQAWEAAVMEDGPGGEERSWGRRQGTGHVGPSKLWERLCI